MQAIRGSIKDLVYYVVGYQQMTEEQVFYLSVSFFFYLLPFHSQSNALY